MKVKELKINPDNPRKILPEQLEKLKRSISSFQEMMELRPIIYDRETGIVLGGNQRLLAIIALGLDEIPDSWAIPTPEGMTDQQKKEFILKDNAAYGEWDWDILLEGFPEFDLEEMGMDMPKKDEENLVEIKDKEIASIFSIIINFENEESLQIAFEKLQKEGYQCQISIL